METIAAIVTVPAVAAAALVFGAGASSQARYVDFRNSFNSPHIYSPSGEYPGDLNRNQFDPNSVSDQFGAGSQFRPSGGQQSF